MTRMLQRLLADEAGQDLAEYGIALAVIGATTVLIAVAVGQDVQTLWQRGADTLAQLVNP
jgi:Flp pilus assembly pilin Flp